MQKYPDVASLAAAEPEEIEAIVTPVRTREKQGAGYQCLYDVSCANSMADNVPDDF